MPRSALRKLLRSFRPQREAKYASLWKIADPQLTTVLLPKEQIPTPETALMEFLPFSDYLDAPYYVASAVQSSLLSQVRYCPTTHCILTKDNAVILESTGPGARPVGRINPYAFNRPTRRIKGIATSFRCCFNDFYHLLIDNLSRVDLLNFDHFRQFSEISLLCPSGLTDLEAFFVEKLLPPNVSVVDVDTDHLYEPDQFIFNNFITRRSSGYLRGPFVERLHARLGLDPVPRQTERIMISRRKAPKGRRIRNEDALMERLRPLGFQRYLLEELPIDQQIALFHRAEAVVAPHGAGLSNLLFSKPTRMLELFPSTYVVPHYYLLAKSMHHRYAFLTGEQPHHDEDFTVNVEAVEQTVQHLLTVGDDGDTA